MGYWLKTRLHTMSEVPANATYRYKLPTMGLYSGFSVRLSDIRDGDRSSNTTSQMLHEAITKVELLTEGTKVVKSLRGREVKALNLFDFRHVTQLQHNELDDEYNMDTLYLLAGRSLQDKEYMFDMSRLADPEIALTNVLSADSPYDWDTGALEYQIFGWRWMGDPVPIPKGYLRADERLHYDTTGAGVEKDLSITPGKRIRRILVMGWELGESVAGHFTRLELQVNEGEFSPAIISNPMEWCWQNVEDYGLEVVTGKNCYLIDGGINNRVDVLMCYPRIVTLTPHRDIAFHAERVRSLNAGLVHVVNAGLGELLVGARGAGFLTSLLIGFDKAPDLSDMLDAKDMGKLKLLITETDDGDTISVVVEEEVLY